jgi:hypothetical protein
MLDFKSTPKTQILYMTIQWTFLASLVQFCSVLVIASEGYHSVRSLTVLVYPYPWWDHSSRYSFNVGLYGNIVLTIFFSEPSKLSWQPSWISDRQMIHKFSTGPPNDHSCKVTIQLAWWFLTRRNHQANWINLWIICRSEIQDGCHDLT